MKTGDDEVLASSPPTPEERETQDVVRPKACDGEGVHDHPNGLLNVIGFFLRDLISFWTAGRPPDDSSRSSLKMVADHHGDDDDDGGDSLFEGWEYILSQAEELTQQVDRRLASQRHGELAELNHKALKLAMKTRFRLLVRNEWAAAARKFVASPTPGEGEEEHHQQLVARFILRLQSSRLTLDQIQTALSTVLRFSPPDYRQSRDDQWKNSLSQLWLASGRQSSSSFFDAGTLDIDSLVRRLLNCGMQAASAASQLGLNERLLAEVMASLAWGLVGWFEDQQCAFAKEDISPVCSLIHTLTPEIILAWETCCSAEDKRQATPRSRCHPTVRTPSPIRRRREGESSKSKKNDDAQRPGEDTEDGDEIARRQREEIHGDMQYLRDRGSISKLVTFLEANFTPSTPEKRATTTPNHLIPSSSPPCPSARKMETKSDSFPVVKAKSGHVMDGGGNGKPFSCGDLTAQKNLLRRRAVSIEE